MIVDLSFIELFYLPYECSYKSLDQQEIIKKLDLFSLNYTSLV